MPYLDPYYTDEGVDRSFNLNSQERHSASQSRTDIHVWWHDVQPPADLFQSPSPKRKPASPRPLFARTGRAFSHVHNSNNSSLHRQLLLVVLSSPYPLKWYDDKRFNCGWLRPILSAWYLKCMKSDSIKLMSAQLQSYDVLHCEGTQKCVLIVWLLIFALSSTSYYRMSPMRSSSSHVLRFRHPRKFITSLCWVAHDVTKFPPKIVVGVIDDPDSICIRANSKNWMLECGKIFWRNRSKLIAALPKPYKWV